MITALGVVMLVVHGVRSLLGPEADTWVLLQFAFIPARYEPAYIGEALGPDVWTFVSYAFLHGSLAHIGINLLWMVAFGSPVARRFGVGRFLAFFAVTAAAGAVAHLLTHQGEIVPLVGASGAIAGFMAGAVRFIFAAPGFAGMGPQGFEHTMRQPAAPLGVVLRDRRVIGFVAVWFLINIGIGVGLPVGTEAGGTIAWQAHIGGFLAGLLLFPLFDPLPRLRSDADVDRFFDGDRA
ncbi:rhomboid family intramembrane serine protease [Ancylobacter lacus]|uniref:rhomboid family intramembrane serine protease n=1 Tax=Ancylobacter lacus TaxID=2579970 RepID=UPI0031B8A82E